MCIIYTVYICIAVFVLNHATPHDFQPQCLRGHHSLLVDLFTGTKANIEGIYTVHIHCRYTLGAIVWCDI